MSREAAAAVSHLGLLDAIEMKNLAREPEQQGTVQKLAAQLLRNQKEIASHGESGNGVSDQ